MMDLETFYCLNFGDRPEAARAGGENDDITQLTDRLLCCWPFHVLSRQQSVAILSWIFSKYSQPFFQVRSALRILLDIISLFMRPDYKTVLG